MPDWNACWPSLVNQTSGVAWQVKRKESRYMEIAQFIFHFLLHSSARYLHGNCISCYRCDLWLLVQRFHYHCGNLCPLRYCGLLIWNCVPISFFFFFCSPSVLFQAFFPLSLEPKSDTGLKEIGTLQAEFKSYNFVLNKCCSLLRQVNLSGEYFHE